MDLNDFSPELVIVYLCPLLPGEFVGTFNDLFGGFFGDVYVVDLGRFLGHYYLL